MGVLKANFLLIAHYSYIFVSKKKQKRKLNMIIGIDDKQFDDDNDKQTFTYIHYIDWIDWI